MRPKFYFAGVLRLTERIRLNASTESDISVLVPSMPRVRNLPDIMRFIVPKGCSAEHLRCRIKLALSAPARTSVPEHPRADAG